MRYSEEEVVARRNETSKAFLEDMEQRLSTLTVLVEHAQQLQEISTTNRYCS